jgi:hypothetical protein
MPKLRNGYGAFHCTPYADPSVAGPRKMGEVVVNKYFGGKLLNKDSPLVD